MCLNVADLVDIGKKEFYLVYIVLTRQLILIGVWIKSRYRYDSFHLISAWLILLDCVTCVLGIQFDGDYMLRLSLYHFNHVWLIPLVLGTCLSSQWLTRWYVRRYSKIWWIPSVLRQTQVSQCYPRSPIQSNKIITSY